MLKDLGILESIGKWVIEKANQGKYRKRIYIYLKENTMDKAGEQFKTTLEIASYTNLSEETVENICYTHKDIYQSVEDREKWSIHSREEKSIYEERGVLTI